MIKQCDCVTDDQFPELLDAMRWADGVVLCSPIYVFCAAGSVQNMIPRFFHIGYSGEMEGKLGLAIAAGGGPGVEAFALPQVSMLFHYLSMPVIDQFRGYGQGPGEVFDDESACRRALESGAAMARGEKAFRGETGACPFC